MRLGALCILCLGVILFPKAGGAANSPNIGPAISLAELRARSMQLDGQRVRLDVYVDYENIWRNTPSLWLLEGAPTQSATGQTEVRCRHLERANYVIYRPRGIARADRLVRRHVILTGVFHNTPFEGLMAHSYSGGPGGYVPPHDGLLDKVVVEQVLDEQCV